MAGDTKKTAEMVIDRLGQLKPEHQLFEKLWRDCAEFCLLFHEGIGGNTDRYEISPRVFDETAVLARAFFDCALHGMMANPAGTWYSAVTEDPNLMEKSEVREFLQNADKVTHHILNNTNFHKALNKEFTHISTFGIAPFFCGEDLYRGAYFFPAFIGNTYVAENHQGLVDTVLREHQYTARQAAQKFGEDRLPPSIKKIINATDKTDRERKFTFLHLTCPRADRDVRSRKGVDMPFASIYVNAEEKALITEGGYHEMPWATARWDVPWRSPYACSPAMTILAAIKGENIMTQDNEIAGHKMLEPPMQIPLELKGAVKMYSGGLNYFDSKKGEMKPAVTISNVIYALEMLKDKRERIEQGFFKHLLQLPLKPDMPIIEVMARLEEQVRVLGPMVGPLFFELFSPSIDRIFGMFLRAGYYGRPPEILQGQPIKIQYMSSIARAQKISEAKAALQANEILGPLMQVWPEMKDNFDGDKIGRGVAESMGTPQNWLKDEGKRDELRALQAQMIKEQQAIAQLAQGADVAGKLKEALAAAPAPS